MARIEIYWDKVHVEHPHWNAVNMVYAYVCPTTNSLLYVGKAEVRTVGQRFTDPDKRKVHRQLKRSGFATYDVYAGPVRIHGNSKATLEMVEAALIFEHVPIGNDRNTKSFDAVTHFDIRHLGKWPRFRQTAVQKGEWRRE